MCARWCVADGLGWNRVVWIVPGHELVPQRSRCRFIAQSAAHKLVYSRWFSYTQGRQDKRRTSVFAALDRRICSAAKTAWRSSARRYTIFVGRQLVLSDTATLCLHVRFSQNIRHIWEMVHRHVYSALITLLLDCTRARCDCPRYRL